MSHQLRAHRSPNDTNDYLMRLARFLEVRRAHAHVRRDHALIAGIVAAMLLAITWLETISSPDVAMSPRVRDLARGSRTAPAQSSAPARPPTDG